MVGEIQGLSASVMMIFLQANPIILLPTIDLSIWIKPGRELGEENSD